MNAAPASPLEGFKRAFAGAAHEAFTLNAAPREDGARPAALFVHGFPGSPNEMRPLAEAFHGAGWTARVILLPGFGADIESLGERRHAEWAEAVTDAMIDLRRDYAPVVLVGYSMGGALALGATAQSHPDGLILIAPFTTLEHALWRALPAIKLVIKQFKPFTMMKVNFDDPQTRLGISQFMPGADLDDPVVQAAIRDFAVPTAMLDEIRQAGIAAHDAAERVTVPTLIVQGTRDDLVRPGLTRALAARIRGARLVELAAEHNLNDPSRPAWAGLLAAVLGFANGIAPAAG